MIILLGFLVGAVLVFALSLITLHLYSFLNSRKVGRRLLPLNYRFIIAIFLIVLAIHIVCIAFSLPNDLKFDNPSDWFDAIGAGLKEIFMQIGGLKFEGQSFDYDNAPSWASMLYFGSILWLAVCDVFLVVWGFSYPLYSQFSLSRQKRFAKKDYFIFTYVTTDSLILADSIKEQYTREGKKCAIIFSSYEIAPFDKDNELHFKILQSDYLFIPIPKVAFKKRKSIVNWLFPLKNMTKFLKDNNVSIFALAENDEKYGYESKNSDMVFDDIELVLNDLCKKGKKRSFNELFDLVKKERICLNYYVLSNHDINFEFYERSLVGKFTKCFKEEELNLLLRELPPLFNINVLNEAIMSAEHLVYKRHVGLKYFENGESFLNGEGQETIINHKESGVHRSLVIGFGLNGQTALGHLYSDCIGGVLDDNNTFVPDKFAAEVIDDRLDEKITSFIVSHPAYVFINGKYDPNITSSHNCYAKLRENYKDYSDFDNIVKHMAFPQIFLRQENYNNETFLETLNDICNREYNSIIIALGDDERNIECANSILLALRQTLNHKKNNKTQIFVNIRDFHNNQRLLWDNNRDSKINDDIYVFAFGNAQKIYSYDKFNMDGAIRIDRTYQEINGECGSDDPLVWRYHFLKSCGLFERKTNAAAYDYGFIYDAFLKRAGAIDLIKNDYRAFLDMRKKATPKKELTEQDYKDEKDKILYLNNKLPVDLITNIKAVVGYQFDEDRPRATMANYSRIQAYSNKDYLAKDKAGYYWRYLIQFDHNRWCRHLMMYGRSFIKEFKKSVFDKSENKKGTDNEKYWKNSIRLHDCLLPYSKYVDYTTKPVCDYLKYGEEDYDYGVIVASIGLDAKKD